MDFAFKRHTIISFWSCTYSKQIDFYIMTQINKKRLYIAAAIVVIIFIPLYWLFFASFSSSSKPSFVRIDKDDTVDSVYTKLEKVAEPRQMIGLKMACCLVNYAGNIHTGRYTTGEGISTIKLVRNLRGGRQASIGLVIPVVHTLSDLAGRLSKQLQMDSVQLNNAFHDPKLLKQFGVDTTNLACLFIPNTYEVYWNINTEQLLKRMKKEHDEYWTKSRTNKAKEAGLTPDEAYTLASIVEQESVNPDERPMIAGMYINRLHQGMRLQADPTVKFALQDFNIRRITHAHLSVDSPYNTYRNAGLPIGPICIPSIDAIEAVLNYTHHDYIYMCAKPDFSGTHNFASTYEEHMKNAHEYAEALNKRGVK